MRRTALIVIALSLPLAAAAEDDVPLVEDWAAPAIEEVSLDADPMDALLGPAPVVELAAPPLLAEAPPALAIPVAPVAPSAPAGTFVLVAPPAPVAPVALVVGGGASEELDEELEELREDYQEEAEELAEELVELREDYAEEAEEILEEYGEEMEEDEGGFLVSIRSRMPHIPILNPRPRVEVVLPAPPVPPAPPARPERVEEPEVEVRDRDRHPAFVDLSMGTTFVDGQPNNMLDLTAGWYPTRHLSIGFFTGGSMPRYVRAERHSMTLRTGIVPSLVFGRDKRIRVHGDVVIGWGAMMGLDGRGAWALYTHAVPRVGAEVRVAKNLYVGATTGYRTVLGSELGQELLGGPEAGLVVRFGR